MHFKLFLQVALVHLPRTQCYIYMTLITTCFKELKAETIKRSNILINTESDPWINYKK